MSKELVISSNRHETRVALIEDDQLVEVYFQRANEYSLAGSIHKGRVTRVLPGMQSAFVDLGLERDTFLYVSDFLDEHEDIDRVTGDEPAPRGRDQRDQRDRGGRDRDRDRDRRPQNAQPPPLPGSEEVVAAEGTASEGAAEAAVVQADGAEANSAETPAVAPVSSEVSQDRGPNPNRGEERDRHGRRSRRRRRGGRGFPDSKYAGSDAGRGAADQRESQAAAPVASSFEASESTESSDTPVSNEPPLILPGESLAKYRGAPASFEASSPEASSYEAPIEETAPRVESRAVPPPLPPPLPPPIPVEEFDEPAHFPRENAIPDAPIHRTEVAAAAPAIDEAAVVEEEEDAIEAEAAEGPAVASLLDEDEDRDIQDMILSHAEGIDVEGVDESEGEESEEAAEGVAGEESNASADGTPGEPRAEAESGSAAVRERSGRYPHRGIGRRSRRRGRGGERGDRPGGDRQAGDRPGGERQGGDRPERSGDRSVSRPSTGLPPGVPSISDLLKEGQEIIVQIAKEPLGQKGARITSHIALPGRYVVFMPTLEHMGVSRKISSDEERLRLKRILQGRRPGPLGGFITRTAAEGRTEEEIAADMAFLYNLWMDIRNKAEKRPAPMLLHHDLDIVQRILRDQLADNFKAIWIDNEDAYESVLRFVERFQPALVGKVKLYTRESPIFDAFNVTSELEKALRPKVWLKSGGYIVINQTEALVAIDVNTGKYVGKSNRLEDTIVKTNTEAIKEIVRQVRLRDLGGIIVIDFIDMDERRNRQKVMQTLEEAMRVDRAPYKILQFNDFGLVAITRKRVKQSLERTLCSPCPHCDGAGYIKSVQTVVSEILTEARKMASSVEGKDVMLRVHPDVAKVLKSNQNKFLEELEEVLRRPVLVRSDAQLHHEKFDLA
jgi:ribonuclease G